VPDSATVWKTAKVNLYVYKDYRNVLLKTINVTDGGNNLYVDHINVGAQTSRGVIMQEQFILTPVTGSLLYRRMLPSGRLATSTSLMYLENKSVKMHSRYRLSGKIHCR
jgi:hypothetical protein